MVVAPDVGGIKMARAYAKALDSADLAIVDKRRISRLARSRSSTSSARSRAAT